MPEDFERKPFYHLQTATRTPIFHVSMRQNARKQETKELGLYLKEALKISNQV